MIKLIILFIYLQISTSTDCGISPSVERYSRIFSGHRTTKRIVGGDVAQEKDWPWLVVIEYDHGTGVFACTGSIVHEHWILVAAHCVVGGEHRPHSFFGKEFRIDPKHFLL